jgi:Na+/H+ antiporter NhaD/arsenite permease-like protein
MLRAAFIFIAVYAGLVVTRRFRPHIAWLGIIVALVLGVLRPAEIFLGINWNVIGIFVGSLMLAELFIFSRVPETISDLLINKSPSLGVAFLLIIIFTSILSAFIENVATVLILAPVALELTRKAGVSPVPVIVGLAVSSNLQGTATLIGDPPSMIMAANMKMNFLDFFLYQGKLGIFFFVEAGAVAGFIVLYLFLRGIKQRPEPLPVTPVTSWVPVYFIGLMILLLSLAGLIDPDFVWFGGAVCIVMGLAGCAWLWLRERREAQKLLRSIDWQTIAFLAGVFVLVTMLERRGAIDALVGGIGFLAGADRFVVYTIVVWFSVLVSAFIDNVPYITAFLPVVIGLSERLEYPSEVLVFGVLIGSCLGGNITPIGASANIVSVGILQREGHPVSFGSFVKIGLPFTIAATVVSYILLWLLYR